jgi:hypothetical protein
MSNARILAQLEKFARDINAETMSLNQRVPGSSPGAPTKQDQVLPTLLNQNGPFQFENSGTFSDDLARQPAIFYDFFARR